MAKIVTGAGIARDAAVARAKFYLFDPGVYTGSAELKDGPLRIWPIMRFLRALTAGDILG